MPRHRELKNHRSRSRSPRNERTHQLENSAQRSLSSGHRHENRSKRRKEGHSVKSKDTKSPTLPYGALMLTKDHFRQYQPLFAQYLELQKQLDLSVLESAEAKGRWKSFVKKWNRYELAEGWYDPERLQKASEGPTVPMRKNVPLLEAASGNVGPQTQLESSSEDDGPGPYLDRSILKTRVLEKRSGPSIPTLQDLELRKELEADAARQARTDLHREQVVNRAKEKERLEDIAPKAAAGTRERQIEKKRERAFANRSFADAKSGADMVEIGDGDLMGEGEEGVDAYKKQAKEVERKKNEREIRREEIMRAKQEERQQRAREIQDKEDRTMQGLLELAKQRFG